MANTLIRAPGPDKRFHLSASQFPWLQEGPIIKALRTNIWGKCLLHSCQHTALNAYCVLVLLIFPIILWVEAWLVLLYLRVRGDTEWLGNFAKAGTASKQQSWSLNPGSWALEPELFSAMLGSPDWISEKVPIFLHTRCLLSHCRKWAPVSSYTRMYTQGGVRQPPVAEAGSLFEL